MAIKIYHNPRCSKSRQTLQLLGEHDVEPEVIEYLKTPPDEKTLREILKQLGLKPRQLMRTKEALYTELGLADESLSDDELIQAMLDNPKLIERPIVVKDGKAVIGRPPENVLSIL
ncbi:MAG: arsenate reductase (glutaredoxin) [Thioalkalispiraceae bacterium]|jgi:arsenate reductase